MAEGSPEKLAPVRVERLGAPAPAAAPTEAATPSSPAPAELVTLSFVPVPASDAGARERIASAPALALVAESTGGEQLLRVPRAVRARRTREPVTLPPAGPDPSLGPRDAWAVLLVDSPRPVAFGAAPPPPVDYDRWLSARPPTPGIGLVRVNLRGAMVAAASAPEPAPRYLESPEMLLVGNGRAVLVAPPSSRESHLDVLAAFAFLERELARLEQEVASIYAGEAEGHDALLGPLDAAALGREAAHGAHAARLARVRREFAQIEPLLDRAPQELTEAQRHLFELLGANHGVEARLEALDDRLEVLQDQAEIAGERLLESNLARREMRLEWLIVAILVIEILVVVLEAALARTG